jgi:hypothetical protein
MHTSSNKLHLFIFLGAKILDVHHAELKYQKRWYAIYLLYLYIIYTRSNYTVPQGED